MATAYVGLGANLDEPIQQLRAALQSLARLPQTRVAAKSSFYRSAPIGMTAQPFFINAVCALQTDLPPSSLMMYLLEVERAHGRIRSAERNGPRTLDLDLLLYESQVVETPALTLPHPRMHERAFVLQPLAELAPKMVVPGRGPIAQLLQACAEQQVERIENC